MSSSQSFSKIFFIILIFSMQSVQGICIIRRLSRTACNFFYFLFATTFSIILLLQQYFNTKYFFWAAGRTLDFKGHTNSKLFYLKFNVGLLKNSSQWIFWGIFKGQQTLRKPFSASVLFHYYEYFLFCPLHSIWVSVCLCNVKLPFQCL